MKYVMKRNNRVRSFGLQWLVLLAWGASSGAMAAQCPSDHFEGFIKEFSVSAQLQQAFTASPVTEQTVVAAGSKPRVVQKKSRSLDASTLAMLSPESLQRSGLSMTVQLPDQLYVRDHKGEVLKVFSFKHNDCWVLNRVEDWSIESVLNAQNVNAQSSPGARSFKRGELFNQLAIDNNSSSSAQLYVSALDSYLDGADQGSAPSAFAAAGISLSGQAPRLENSKILDLLVYASKSVPEAGLALADFYCDEGNYEEKQACANPEKSLSTLIEVARSGYALALIQLGSAYEAGAIVQTDLPRAMACYKEAEKGGNEAASSNVERLRSQGTVDYNNTHCL